MAFHASGEAEKWPPAGINVQTWAARERLRLYLVVVSAVVPAVAPAVAGGVAEEVAVVPVVVAVVSSGLLPQPMRAAPSAATANRVMSFFM